MKQIYLKLSMLLACMLIGLGSAWGEEGDVFYTLTATQSSSNSAYAGYSDVTIDGLTWNAPGNQYVGSGWRIGGKEISKIDRTITGKSPIGCDISKVTMNHNGVSNSNLIVHSIKLTVASDANFTNIVETVTKTSPIVSSQGSIDFEPANDDWANGSYYKLTINVSNSKSTNYGLDFMSLVFYEGSSSTSTPKHTVTWSVDGATTNNEYYEGATITFPSPEATINGMVFRGWTTSIINGTQAAVPTFVTTATMGSEDVTYYAVYAREDASGETCQKITNELEITAGTYAIISFDGTYYLPNAVATNACPKVSAVRKSGEVISVSDDMKWNLTINEGCYIFESFSENGKYLFGGSANDAIRVNNISKKDNATKNWYVKQTDDYGLVLYNKATTDDRYLSTYGTSDWRNYKSTSSIDRAANLYKFGDGLSYSNYCTTVPEAISATISAAGYATFVPNKNVTVPEDVTAYAVKVEGSVAKLNAVNAIPANTAVVIKGGEGTYYFPVTSESVETINTDLKYSDSNITANGSQYILAKKDGVVGFYKATTGTTIKAGKAYLENSSNVKSITFEEVTGVNTIAKSVDVNAPVYNLRGQRVSADYKGIVIKNGKKYLNK